LQSLPVNSLNTMSLVVFLSDAASVRSTTAFVVLTVLNVLYPSAAGIATALTTPGTATHPEQTFKRINNNNIMTVNLNILYLKTSC